jgi:hypothetical protein
MIIMDLIMLKAATKLNLLFIQTGLWRERLAVGQTGRKIEGAETDGQKIN